MTTDCSPTAHCEHCAAAAAEAAAARVTLRQIIDALCIIALSYRQRIDRQGTPAYEYAQNVLERLGIDLECLPSDTADTAVAALERRLAPMPCGHPGSCAVSSGDPDCSTNHCGWCEDIKTKQGADLAFHMAAMDGMEAKVKKWEGIAIIAHSELEQAEARAEALAALVPETELLKRLATFAESVAICFCNDSPGHPPSRQDAADARVLAASIEEAQQEQKREDGDDHL